MGPRAAWHSGHTWAGSSWGCWSHRCSVGRAAAPHRCGRTGRAGPDATLSHRQSWLGCGGPTHGVERPSGGQGMNLQRLTEKSQEALRNAQALAIRRSHQGVDAEHLLAALLDTPQSLATSIVERAGSNVSTLRKAIEREV